jgi:single-stranded-DNA-specific exonuclease
MKYKWNIKEHNNISKEFLEIAFNSEIIAKMLLNRGIDSPQKAKEYLYPEEYTPSRPEEIPGLVKAKERIIKAINENEKITIFGDYDVDGTTSAACLILTLKQFTNNIDFYIPNRLSEGYGLNLEAVRAIAKKSKRAGHDTPLLITCDCGITNVKEVELANELGMDVIITDHHSLPEILPPAHAILNPKQLPEGHKLHFLPGVGVAYKLAEAILEDMCHSRLDRESIPLKDLDSHLHGNDKKNNPIAHTELLDLVTLGMIADLAPLVDENRYLVQIGLPRLAYTKKLGLRELLRVCGLSAPQGADVVRGKDVVHNVSTEHIGFGIAPRINAVGRLTDANLAVKLMTTEDLLEAVNLATELEFQNRQRQTLCEETVKDAISLVSEEVDFEKDKCIIIAKENWHHGIIGIVASRVLEKFSLPTLLICIDKEQNIARGSGRSIGALNIVDVLNECSSHLEKFGGHKAACGLSIKPENIESFIDKFKNTTNKLLEGHDISPVLMVDSNLSISDVNIDLIEKINKLSPFGFGNKMPIFASDEVEIVGLKSIGKDGQHLKLTLLSVIARGDVKTFEALIWNYDKSHPFEIGENIKIAYTPKINSFNGNTSIQLEVKDCERVEQVIEVRNQPPKASLAQLGGKSEDGIAVFDYRMKTEECINEVGNSVLFFAEVSQKDFLPLKTYSRNNISKCENLVFLDLPPAENIFLDVVNKAQPKNVYLAYSPEHLEMNPHFLMRRLIGMIRYVVNNKDSKVSEIQLQSALGINKTALAYALQSLEKIGFLGIRRGSDVLNIDILETSRQNFEELIEYNLLVSEMKKIQKFHLTLLQAKINEIGQILNKQKELANVRNN